MTKTVCAMLAMALAPFCAFAVDGVVLINQSTVTAAGGFPYTISQAGSYKLSGNLLVPNGVQGIVISASNVTLDLNGFSITSVDGTGETFMVAVSPLVAQKGVTVRNGIISCANCFPIDTSNASGTVLEDLTLMTGGNQLVILGSSVIVRRVLFPGGRINVKCPALVVDSLAGQFTRNTTSSTACTFGSVSGTVQ